jgi:hypothetical protein
MTSDAAAAAGEKLPLVLLFDCRCLFETTDLDAHNHAAWMETLDNFGYNSLDRASYVADLAFCTSYEVMAALCPFTTKAEWEPVLNKRTMRLQREVEDMCYANVVPIPGVVEFITGAARSAEYSSVTTVFLSPYEEAVTKRLLIASDLGPLVDLTVCYTARNTAVLQALEALKARPPVLPRSMVQVVDGDELPWFSEDPEGVARREGEGEAEHVARVAAQTVANAAALEAARLASGVEVRAVGFASSRASVRDFAAFGVTVVGVEHNNHDQESDEPELLEGCDAAADLLAAGSVTSMPTFKGLRAEHLKHIVR